MRFRNSIAIVTGGGSGIGRATAERLSREGAQVVILDVDQDRAELVVASVTTCGGTASFLHTDVSDDRAVESAFDEIVTRFGVPNIVVSCAGILHVAPALDTTLTAFDRVISINLRSVFMVSVAAARRMIAGGITGSIVNVTSIHAVISEPNASAYTAAKGGIEAMSRTFASEWAKYGIRVNCVRPGATRTSLTEELYTDGILNALALRIPLKHPASPEQIAAGICFLASPDADYITGTALDVDGGYIMDGSLPQIEYR